MAAMRNTNTIGDSSQDQEHKQVGVFGAPACKGTPALIALCASLGGLILVAIGACALAFINQHEPIVEIPSYAMIVLGVGMIIGGIGYFAYDAFAPKRPNFETYSVSYSRGGPDQGTRGPTSVSTSDAPPAYDSITVSTAASSMSVSSQPQQQPSMQPQQRQQQRQPPPLQQQQQQRQPPPQQQQQQHRPPPPQQQQHYPPQQQPRLVGHQQMQQRPPIMQQQQQQPVVRPGAGPGPVVRAPMQQQPTTRPPGPVVYQPRPPQQQQGGYRPGAGANTTSV